MKVGRHYFQLFTTQCKSKILNDLQLQCKKFGLVIREKCQSTQNNSQFINVFSERLGLFIHFSGNI